MQSKAHIPTPLLAAAHLLPRPGVPTVPLPVPAPVPVPVGSGGPLEATTGGTGAGEGEAVAPLDMSPSTAGEGEGLGPEGALLAASHSTRVQPLRWMSRLQHRAAEGQAHQYAGGVA